jgi:hypothetical protein
MTYTGWVSYPCPLDAGSRHWTYGHRHSTQEAAARRAAAEVRRLTRYGHRMGMPVVTSLAMGVHRHQPKRPTR